MRRLLSHVGRADPGAAVVFDDWPLPPPAPPTDGSNRAAFVARLMPKIVARAYGSQ